MENLEYNPISGEQVPFQELAAQSQTVDPYQQGQPLASGTAMQPMPQAPFAGDPLMAQKMKNQKMMLIIMGVVLAIVILILFMVVSILSKRGGDTVTIVATPIPMATAVPDNLNENVPKDISSRVKVMEEKVANLDLEEKELSFPKLDWEINY